MTTDLVCYEPPCIRITVPPARTCEANGCDGPSKSHMIWWENRQMLHLLEVCGFHLFTLRGRGPAQFYPLDCAPSLESVAAELNRRFPPQPVYQSVQFINLGGVYASTGTASGWGNVRWG